MCMLIWGMRKRTGWQGRYKKRSVLSVIYLSLLQTKKTHTGAVYTGLPRGDGSCLWFHGFGVG